jgi:hypothetical protein
MRRVGPFGLDDLHDLDSLYARADRVIPMRDVHKGDTNARAVAVRHDVDDNPGAFDTALEMGRWEFEHGYSTSYYLLHTAGYWDSTNLVRALELQELGHEVGLHVNALAHALRNGGEPEAYLSEALEDLRSVGLRVDGCCAHGDPICRAKDGTLLFVNDELFLESMRPKVGAWQRVIERNGSKVRLLPLSRSTYGLAYDAAWLSRGDYLSDSGHVWSQSFAEVCKEWPGRGQLHLLIHPDWWYPAFQQVAV